MIEPLTGTCSLTPASPSTEICPEGGYETGPADCLSVPGRHLLLCHSIAEGESIDLFTFAGVLLFVVASPIKKLLTVPMLHDLLYSSFFQCFELHVPVCELYMYLLSSQKKVVDLVNVTLAIGDGANNVGMIKGGSKRSISYSIAFIVIMII